MYLITLLILACFATIEIFNPEIIQRNKLAFIFGAFSLMVFHDGFRWETGCDWDAYHYFYEFFFQEIQKENSLTKFEPGYILFVGAIRSLTDEFSVYLIIHAIVFYTMILYGLQKNTTHPFTALMFIYMVIVPYMGTNRQLLALGIFLIALYHLNEGRKWVYIGLIVLAAFFHKSVFICLCALFLDRKINMWLVGTVMAIAMIINLSGILNMLSPLVMLFIKDDQMSMKMEVYNELLDYKVSPIITLISMCRKLLWIGILTVYARLVDNKDKCYYTFFNLYIVGTVIYVLLNGSVWQMFMTRLNLYFGIFEAFIIVYVLSLFKPNYGKLLLVFLLTGYCYATILKGFSNYGENTDYFEPYKGIFINTDYVRHNTD